MPRASPQFPKPKTCRSASESPRSPGGFGLGAATRIVRPMRLAVASSLVFLLASAVFGAFIPKTGFSDPDAFYHAQSSVELAANGTISAFRWLDLTALGPRYADLHWFFHVWTIPFQSWFGPMDGLRIATVLAAAACVTVVFLMLRRNRLTAWPWIAILLITPSFLFRLSLGKASAFALAAAALGIGAAMARRPWIAFAAGIFFALSHGGWPMLLIAMGSALAGEWLFDRAVLGTWPTWRSVVPLAAAMAGIVLGVLGHPNRATYFEVWRLQAVDVPAIAASGELSSIGKEWRSAAPMQLLSSVLPWAFVLGIGAAGLVFARRPFDAERSRKLVMAFVATAPFVVFALQSRRHAEYLAIALPFLGAALWDLVDVTRLREEADTGFVSFGRRGGKVLRMVVVGLLLFVPVRILATIHRELQQDLFLDRGYAEVLDAVRTVAKPGDRVFHQHWDDFGPLWRQGSEFRYVAGLDPSFLHLTDPDFSRRYMDFGRSDVPKPEELLFLMETSKSRIFVLSKRGKWQNIEKILDSAGLKRVQETGEAIVAQRSQ